MFLPVKYAVILNYTCITGIMKEKYSMIISFKDKDTISLAELHL